MKFIERLSIEQKLEIQVLLFIDMDAAFYLNG